MSYVCDPMSAYWYPTIASQWSRISAFRPWSPVVDKDGKPILNQAMPQQSAYFRDNNSQTLPSYLSRGPPVLLNPERVVPNSETERFERHYQPNVALAPPTAQQISQKIRLSLAANALMINSSRERRIIPNNITAKVMNPEMEMSTDTDETLSDSTTNAESIDYQYEIIGDGTKNNSLEDNNKVDEIESLRKLMEANKIGAAPQQEIVQEVEKIRKKDKVEAEAAKKEKNALQQELEYVKMSKREKLREATEAKRHLRKQLQQMDEEHSAQMKEQMLVQKQLRSQLAAALGIKQEASETNSRGKKVVKNESPIEDIAAAGGKVMNEPNVKMEKERD
uniref:Uncharacterized protein n=1 Tax=Strigamia maritima TaxID=126957 RepID=T1IV83_STRMM